MSWPLVELGDLMASRVPSVSPAKHPDETFELWSIPAFDEGSPELTVGSEIGSAKKVVETNDVLLSRIVPHIRRSWVVTPPSNGARQIASSEWIIFRNDRIYAPYLRHVLVGDTFHAAFMGTVAGVGGSLLRARPEAVKQIKIALPPLPEQQRIAAILDQADALRRLRRQSISRISELGQAIFFDMFGDLRNSVGHWEEHPLGTLSDVVRGSSPRPQGDPRYFGGPIPRLMIADITRDGMKVMPSIDSLTVEGATKSRPMKRGDVVMAVSGAVGLPAILSIDACIHDGFVGFRSLSSKITPEFLFHFLRVRRNKNSSQGTGAIWKNLTTDQVKALGIACPPLELQKEFKLRMETLEDETSKARHGSKVVESLFASLQYRAFRGDL